MGWDQLASALAPEVLHQLRTQLSRDERRIGARLQRTKQGKLDELRSRQRVRNQETVSDEYLDFTRGKGQKGGDVESVPSAARSPLSREPAAVGAGMGTRVDGTCGAGQTDSGAVLVAERETGHPDTGDDLEVDMERAFGAGHPDMDKVPRPAVTSQGVVNDARSNDKAGCRQGVVTDDVSGRTRTGKGHPRKCDAGNVKVTNLSDKKLSPDQLSLLGKGLGFVPVRRQRITH